MTGPEHYCEAEALLEAAWCHNADAMNSASLDSQTSAYLAAAQVHATLALAAATALGESGDMPLEDLHTWKDVASSEPAEGGPS